MIQIDPKDGVPIYRQVIDQVKLLIMTGQLKSGDQIESVKSLSVRLKVNPMTISKAFGFLVEEGVVLRKKGVGIFVSSQDSQKVDSQRKQLLSDALRQAAGLTVQMDVSPQEALEIFNHHLNDFLEKRSPKK